MNNMKNKNFWGNPLVRSKVRSDDVKVPEMLLGYLIGTLRRPAGLGHFHQHPADLLYGRAQAGTWPS